MKAARGRQRPWRRKEVRADEAAGPISPHPGPDAVRPAQAPFLSAHQMKAAAAPAIDPTITASAPAHFHTVGVPASSGFSVEVRVGLAGEETVVDHITSKLVILLSLNDRHEAHLANILTINVSIYGYCPTYGHFSPSQGTLRQQGSAVGSVVPVSSCQCGNSGRIAMLSEASFQTEPLWNSLIAGVHAGHPP